MDEHSSGFYSSCSSNNKENQDQISFLLGLHIPPPTCSSYSSASAAGSSQPSHSRQGEQMPHPYCYPTSGGGEDSGAGNEFGAVGSLGADQDAFLPGGRRSVEPDLDSLDCESEEGLDVSEEPSKPTPARTSGSKRSRAAEVHNLSEKRRRSRINEKMKALQNLIPNSNKTDKASMLDEAIEYLKQLQLQVQMLSMRNGLNLHPMYLSGSLQPLQASQMLFGFGSDNDRTLNVGMSMLPQNQDAATQSSIGLSAQCTSSRQSTTISGISAMTNPETSFNARQSLQSDPESFQFPVTTEAIFTADFVRQQQQLVSGHSARNLTENEMISMAVNKSRHIGGQASALIGTANLEEHMLGRERSHEMLQKAHNDHFIIQQLQGLEPVRTFPGDDVKEESSQDI